MKQHLKSKQSKINAEVEAELYKAFSLLKTADEARSFMQDLCTPAEIQALADRWRVVADIKAGKSYRQINASTQVSVTTIGRVARCILLGKDGYNLIYARLQKLKKSK
jgi:TrpR-related protein YerC/YecD